MSRGDRGQGVGVYGSLGLGVVMTSALLVDLYI